MCCCRITCPRCPNIDSYSWKPTPKTPHCHVPRRGSPHFCPNVAISFSSFLFLLLCELLKALDAVWHRVGQTLLALWRGMDISCAAAWDGIQVSAGKGWGISSLPIIKTGAFSAQLLMLQARSERRRRSAIWVVSSSGMVACSGTEAMDWMEASCLPIWLQGSHWTALIYRLVGLF